MSAAPFLQERNVPMQETAAEFVRKAAVLLRAPSDQRAAANLALAERYVVHPW